MTKECALGIVFVLAYIDYLELLTILVEFYPRNCTPYNCLKHK